MSLNITIPGSGELIIETLILDLNGTISVYGELVDGVHGKITKILEKEINVVLFSGDTRGKAQSVADKLGIVLVHTPDAVAKKEAAEKLNPDTCCTIGNGLIDLELFKVVKLSIATMQAEGVHIKTLQEADIVVTSVVHALQLLLDEDSLVATLRK